MSRESKILNTSYGEKAETLISHYEAFGWELLAINGSQITMTRETQNPVYVELVKHQSKYEELKAEYHSITYPAAPTPPPPVDFTTCLITFVLAVFPMVLYLVYKHNQKQKYLLALNAYNESVAALNAKKAALLAEMEETVLQSRGIFFARQS